MHNLLNSNKRLVALLGVLFSAIIVIMGLTAILLEGGEVPLFAEDQSSSQSQPEEKPENDETADENHQEDEQQQEPPEEEQPVIFNRPDEMRAVYLTPGKEYLAGEDRSQQAVEREIETALDQAVSLTMNTVVLVTSTSKGAAYPSGTRPQLATAFDPIGYAISAARERGMYVYCIYDLLTFPDEEDKLTAATFIDNEVMDKMSAELKAFVTAYQPDGILFSEYYNPGGEDGYARYLESGGGIGYERYRQAASTAAVTKAAQIVRENARGMQVGLLAHCQWAAQVEDENGSNTTDVFSSYTDGGADVKGWVENGLADFLAVENFGSLTDPKVPFATVADWWGEVAASGGIPFYLVQASDRICTSNTGWSSADQISKQIVEAQKVDGYKGSIFNSLTRLAEDPNDAASLLVKFWNDEVSSDYIMAELAMSQPAKLTYETFEPTVTFQGATYPGIPVTINGEEVSTNQNGYFSVSVELEPGLNTFTVQSKDKVFTYNITRQVKVLQSVTPVGNMTVDGGMGITITVEAYKGSSVSASLNGRTITLEEGDAEDDATDKNSSYVRYYGTFTAPDAADSIQKLGTIQVTATYQGQTETMEGAYVTVNKRAEVGSGVPIRVTASQAEVFPSNTSDDYSDPNCYPLPRGALDYTVGDEIIYRQGSVTYRYYLLESGMRVYSKDIAETSDEAGGNEITGMAVKNNGQYTDVILSMTQNVSYQATYSASAMTFDFNYTDEVCGSLKSLSKNPLFSSATWSGTALTLKFRVSGGMMGYRASYDEGSNTLTLRFNNPPTSLSNARIVIDPGHGGTDPGALGNISGKHESFITAKVADKLESALNNAGADVYRIDTSGSAKVELDDRIAQASSFNPQIFISIHCNSALNTSAKGHEVYYFYPFSKSLATYVNSGIGNAIGTDRGVKYGLYRVTRTSQYASVLSEIGFVSNYDEYSRLLNSSVQQSIASGIVSTLKSYINQMSAGDYGTGTESVGKVDTSGSGVSVSRVRLDESSLTLAPGETAQLTATVSPDDASDQSVSWSSSDEKIATVSGSGKVTAVAAGKAEITVTTTDGGKTDTCTVTVTGESSGSSSESSGSSQDGEKVTGVTLDRESLTLQVGSAQQLEAAIKPENAGNTALSWSSSNDKIASVDADGVVEARKAGEATITVTTKEGGYTASCKVTVTEETVEPEYLIISKTRLTLRPGETGKLSWSLEPEGAAAAGVVWSSSDPAVAEVSADGTVTAKATGTAKITVSLTDYSDLSDTCAVTVSEEGNTSVTGVSVNPAEVTLQAGESMTLEAVITPENAANKGVTWRSRNTDVAEIEDDGTVTAIAPGTAVIIVTTDDGRKTAQCRITVVEASGEGGSSSSESASSGSGNSLPPSSSAGTSSSSENSSSGSVSSSDGALPETSS